MGRAWGTNLMNPNPSLLVAGTDVTCNAGVKTTVLDSGASPLIAAAAGGGFYLVLWTILEIVLGATAPSAIVVTLDLTTAGANQDSYTVTPDQLINSASIVVAPPLYVPTSGSIWYPTGDRVKVTVNPTGQAVTVRASGTRALLSLLQGQ